jgi:hypothetical protein
VRRFGVGMVERTNHAPLVYFGARSAAINQVENRLCREKTLNSKKACREIIKVAPQS